MCTPAQYLADSEALARGLPLRHQLLDDHELAAEPGLELEPERARLEDDLGMDKWTGVVERASECARVRACVCMYV